MIGVGSQLVGQNYCVKKPDNKWETIAAEFQNKYPLILNYNTGSAGMMPSPILSNYITNVNELAASAPYEVKERHLESIGHSMSRLSKLLDVAQEEITLVRNTTEGINSILNNYPFELGDEIVISKSAYPYPHYTVDKLVNSKGIKKVLVEFDAFVDSDELITQKFEQAITPKTKLLITTHILHREGQILPVRRICDIAHKQGVEVLVDAAHALGQIEHTVTDLGCDYYVTSLHKWMHAPLGTGLLYIDQKHLPKIDPGYSFPIDKYDYTGTIAYQNAMSLNAVLDFNERVGIPEKHARLKELAAYLASGLESIPSVTVRTDLARSCGLLALEYHSDLNPIIRMYEEKYGIHIKATGYGKKMKFLRLSLNIHLLESDLDRFIEATKSIN